MDSRGLRTVSAVWNVLLMIFVAISEIILFLMLVVYCIISAPSGYDMAGNWHPVSMGFAALILFTQGILSPRYLVFLDEKKQRYLHAALQCVGMLFLFVGLVLISSSKTNKSYDHFRSDHARLGIVLISFYTLQMLIGFCKFITIGRGRRLHRWHGKAGLLLYTLTLAQIGMGIHILQDENNQMKVMISSTGAGIFYAFLGIMGILVLFQDNLYFVPSTLVGCWTRYKTEFTGEVETEEAEEVVTGEGERRHLL